MRPGEKAWHAMSQKELFRELRLPDDIRKVGLSRWEVSERLAKKWSKALAENPITIAASSVYTLILGFIGAISLFEAVTEQDWKSGIEVILIALVIM